jgi:hypothetical protein
MKTSNWWYVFLFVLGGIAMVAAQNMLFVKAMAQPPASVVVDLTADGTTIDRRNDGKVYRTFTPDGGRVLLGGTLAADPETAKLLQEEMQATQAAQELWRDFRAADSDGDKEKVGADIKAQLREKLVAIFELQQKRRAHEVAQIEKRLAKLKETMSKRDSAKDAIVDRRLDVLTGGVDELGWEETFRPALPPPGPGAANVPQYNPNSPYTPPAVGPQPYRPTAPATPRQPTPAPRTGTPIGVPGPAFLPSPIEPAAPAATAPPDSRPMLTDPVPAPELPLLPAAEDPAASGDDAPATDSAAPAVAR